MISVDHLSCISVLYFSTLQKSSGIVDCIEIQIEVFDTILSMKVNYSACLCVCVCGFGCAHTRVCVMSVHLPQVQNSCEKYSDRF